MSQIKSAHDNIKTQKVPPRLKRELKTVNEMIRIYCRAHHESETSLCQECLTLQQYAAKRLNNCQFLEKKPACGQCTIHCYKPAMRQKIKEVMRFAGPRMIFLHPFLAIMHLIDDKRSKPCVTSNNRDRGEKKA